MNPPKFIWEKVKSSIPNLCVCRRADNSEYVGMIDKPIDSKSEKNAWRAYCGVGESAKFLCHVWSKKKAVEVVEGWW